MLVVRLFCYDLSRHVFCCCMHLVSMVYVCGTDGVVLKRTSCQAYCSRSPLTGGSYKLCLVKEVSPDTDSSETCFLQVVISAGVRSVEKLRKDIYRSSGTGREREYLGNFPTQCT